MASDARPIVSERTVSASPAALFEAFREPERLARWWGPRGFTNTFHEFDLRPGGVWHFTMHAPDGRTFDNHKQFIEIVPGERIVFQHIAPMHRFRMTMTFAAESGGTTTRLTWRMDFETAADADAFRDFITEANEQNFDRLEVELAGESSA